MLTVIVFVVILGILVFVHELGHFVVARRNGIKAEEFGFGFPPRIVGIQFLEPVKKWRIIWGSKDGDDANEKRDLQEAHEKRFAGGTIYSLNWLPIGGFVRIKGEDGDGKNDADSFASKSPWIRIKVLAAGVIMNFILAWLLLSITFMIGSYQDVTGENISGSKILIESIEKIAEKLAAEAVVFAIMSVLFPGSGVVAGGIGKYLLGSLIPGMADGGIAYGPTVAQIGEYPGARSDPEVVAPLSNLMGMLGSQQAVPQKMRLALDGQGNLYGYLDYRQRHINNYR